MLNQLIVTVSTTARTFAGGLRVSVPPGCCNFSMRRFDAVAAAYSSGCQCRATYNTNADFVIKQNLVSAAIAAAATVATASN